MAGGAPTPRRRSKAQPDASRTSSTINASAKVRQSAGIIVAVPPLFTLDGKFMFLARASQIQLWSVTTGSVARTLEGHSDIVTALRINPANALQVSGWRAADVVAYVLDRVCLRSA